MAEIPVDVQETPFRPPFRDRMTVVDKTYHQPAQGEAFCCEVTFERTLMSDESVYSRKKRAGEEWQPLDCGWITEDSGRVGMLIVRNDEGKNLQRLPSDDEKAALAQKVLEVGTHDLPLFVVPPGESLRATPAETPLYVRCLGGECHYTVFAFPN